MKRNQTIFPISANDYRLALTRSVREALREDIGTGDLTCEALDLRGQRGQAHLLAKQSGVLAGADAFAACFRLLDRNAKISWRFRDGAIFKPGEIVATVRAKSAAILSAERSAINFIAHLSGIATATHRLVSKLPRGGRTRLLDTRKTLPGLRMLEKRAARLGGACNHRIGLFDALMIKDNHIAALGDLAGAVAGARRGQGRHRLICEVATMPEIEGALRGGVRWLLLDNFTAIHLQRAVKFIRDFERREETHVICEASGSIGERNIAAFARTGVDYVSVGRITHSAPAVDFSLQWAAQVKTGR
jgi:nicotinate-nucleotide pyrophosphorylase (carboxylating)